MPFFANANKLIAAFGNLEGSGFFDPVVLRDVKVGFSIKREYPADIRYKPAIGQGSGKPDNIAALWIVYTHPDESRKATAELFCSLVIVASLSRYLGGPPTSKYWETIGNSEFLSLIHGLFFIWLLDVVVPWMLFWTINGVISLRTAVLFLKVKGP